MYLNLKPSKQSEFCLLFGEENKAKKQKLDGLFDLTNLCDRSVREDLILDLC